MKIKAVLKALERNTGHFPREAVEAAVARRKEITPYLLDIVANAAHNIERIAKDETYFRVPGNGVRQRIAK